MKILLGAPTRRLQSLPQLYLFVWPKNLGIQIPNECVTVKVVMIFFREKK